MSIFTAIRNDGERLISQSDAELLRKYKQFLQRYDLKEALYCTDCEEAGRPSGLRANVMDGRIDLACRCTVRRHRGQTY